MHTDCYSESVNKANYQRYTTGELAKLCNVTVRTIQYYDSLSLLVPSEVSEGGRRLYNDDDVRKLKIINFLKSMDISLEIIKQLLESDDLDHILSVFLVQQETAMKNQIDLIHKKIESINELKQCLDDIQHDSYELLYGLSEMFDNHKQLKRMHILMNIFGIILIILILTGILLTYILRNIGFILSILLIIVLLNHLFFSYYYKHTEMICPCCHRTFKPDYFEAYFAGHTSTMRNVTCPHCNHSGYSVVVMSKTDSQLDNRIHQ